jgi:hypothetical protein
MYVGSIVAIITIVVYSRGLSRYGDFPGKIKTYLPGLAYTGELSGTACTDGSCMPIGQLL